MKKILATLFAAALCLTCFAGCGGEENKIQTIDLGEGKTYVGEVVDGVPQGEGTLSDLLGSEWKGTFVDGKLQGWGTYVGYDLVEYEGQFVDGQFNGFGTCTYGNGDLYTGQFVNGKPEGVGRMEYTTGCYYEGGWKDGFMDGMGWMTWPVGDAYFGEWSKGTPAGFGCKVYYDASISSMKKGDYTTYNKYVGEMQNNLPHGEGIMYFQGSGGIYFGAWDEGTRDDDWAIYYFEPGIDCVKFEGAFSATKNGGWIWGYGTMWYSDGRIVTGTWEGQTCVEVESETNGNVETVTAQAAALAASLNDTVNSTVGTIG